MKNLLKFQGRIGLNAAYVLIACAVFLFAAFAPLVAEADNPPLFTNKYTRTIGKPNVFSEKFKSCNTGATYKMIVENGGTLGLGRVSAASIALNGNEVVKESDFNQKVDKIERNVTLAEANTLDVKLASGTGGTLNISIFCVANCLEVKIIEPKSGATLSRNFVVKGELYNAQGMIDVKVDNGAGVVLRAYRSGNTFGAATYFRTQESVFTVTAMDACGYRASDAVTAKLVSSASTDFPAEVETSPQFAIVDSKTGFAKVTLITNFTIGGANSFQWDFDGDGSVDETISDSDVMKSRNTHNYSKSGIYYPHIRALYNDGRIAETTGVVVVGIIEELDAEIKPVWNGLRNALSSGDVEGALTFIAPYAREKYRKLYNIMKSNGKVTLAASEMGEPVFKRAADDTAVYLVKRNEVFKGKDEVIAYEIHFERSRKTGLWEITQY